MTKGLLGSLANLLNLLLCFDLGKNLLHLLIGCVEEEESPEGSVGDVGGVRVLFRITEMSGTDTAVLSRSGCGGLPAFPSRFFTVLSSG